MKNVYTKKENCCGCTACYSICPKHAISMKPDQEGFLYPIIDASECVGCDLCKKVCPTQKNMPLESFERHGYVIRALDQSVVSRSTSGGFVSPLADWISKQGGVICGATYDKNFKVVHVISGGGQAFRGSKYVQRDAGMKTATFLITGTWPGSWRPMSPTWATTPWSCCR